MSLSKLLRHLDEAIKNYLDSLRSHQTLTARHNQPMSIFHLDKPSEFLACKKSQRTVWDGPKKSLQEEPARKQAPGMYSFFLSY